MSKENKMINCEDGKSHSLVFVRLCERCSAILTLLWSTGAVRGFGWEKKEGQGFWG